MSAKSRPSHPKDLPPESSSVRSASPVSDLSLRKRYFSTESRWPMYLQSLLRSLKLHVFSEIFTWRKPNEQRKVAIYQNRRAAAMFCLLHLPGLAGALSLLVLNFTRYYVGQFNGFTQLQLVSKLLELLMQASTTIILLHYIRYLACNYSVPFGALLIPTHVSHLSSLWSLELWSTLTSEKYPTRQKLIMRSILPATIIFGAFLGPSSAVAMIPRHVISPALDEVVIIADWRPNKLFSQSVYQPLNVPMNLEPYVNMKQSFAPLNTTIISPTSNSEMNEPRFLTFTNRYCPGVQSEIGIATVPMRIGSALLKRAATDFKPDTTEFLVTQLSIPVAVARCNENSFNKSTETNPLNDGTIFEIPTLDISKSAHHVTWAQLLKDLRTNSPTFTKLRSNGIWTFWRLPAAGANYSLINIVISRSSSQIFEKANETTGTQNDWKPTNRTRTTVRICTVSVFWMPATYKRSYGDTSPVISTTPSANELFHDLCANQLTSASPIRLHPEFFGSNGKTMEEVLVELGNSGAHIYFLPALVAHALSDRGPHTLSTIRFSLYDCSYCFKTTVRKYRTGYGYASWDSTVILSLVVLLLYCLVTFSYIVFTLVSGTCSTAWDSTSALVALALQSRKPDHLGHIGVDVQSMATFREPVKIRVNEEGQVEMVFVYGKDGLSEEWKKIEVNKEY